MNKTSVSRLSIAASAAVAFAFVAVGAITETTDDMTAQGDWEITVAAGDSNVVTVAQSGAGKIIKKGGGWLVLRKNSTFTGGVEIQEGFVMADPDADAGTSGIVNCTALGTGDVTILGQRTGYAGYCELGIVGAGSNDTRIVTIANNIHVEGNTTGRYPALVIYGQNSVITGKITADQNFYFWDDEASTTEIWGAVSSRYLNVLSCTFGEVEVADELQTMGLCRFAFTGRIKAKKINFNVTRTMRAHENSKNTADQNNAHSTFILYEPCEVGEIISGRHPIYCAVENALPGVLINHTLAKGFTGNYFYISGFSPSTAYDQTIGGLTSDTLYDGQKSGNTAYAWGIEGSGGKMLTITGVDPEEGKVAKELVSCTRLRGDFSVTLDAYDGFTQTMSNQIHSISGTIRAKKGTFRVAGTANFAYLAAISVDEDATFDVDTTTANAFNALRTLSVDGTLRVSSIATNALDNGGMINLSLGPNASLALPAGMNLKLDTLSVDGEAMNPGIYTHANLPALAEGASVTVLAMPLAAMAEWSGAAETDNLTTTMGNWKDVPESLSLGDYSLGVTITNSGTEMVYADGMKLNGIDFTRTPAATPFTIRPATPGAVLSVAGRIVMDRAAQLILKDAIIDSPGGIDQGPATSDSPGAMWVSMKKNPDVTTYAASNNFYKTAKDNLPLILDNATIRKPLFMTSDITGHLAIYCVTNTVNEIKGNFDHSIWQPDVYVGENATLTFSGGISYGTAMHKELAGAIIVKDKPLVTSTYFLLYGGTLVLDAEDCRLRGSKTGDGVNLDAKSIGATLEFRRSYCFNGESMLVIRGGSYRNTVEFHSTTQRVTRLCGLVANASSMIHGDHGSLLEVVGGWGSGRTGPNSDMPATSAYRLLTNRVDIAGALSFRMSATNETMTLYSKAFSTCGDLEVSAGTLEFKSDATWLNGTNVAVNGEGRLKVAKGGTFNLMAELSLADGGVFEIPEGASQTFNYVFTNGVPVSSGRHTSLPNGDGDFLAGGGEIIVRRHGFILTLQ